MVVFMMTVLFRSSEGLSPKSSVSVTFKSFCLKCSYQCSGVTLTFEHPLSWASEIENLEIFSCQRENKLAQRFFVKFNLLLFFLIS